MKKVLISLTVIATILIGTSCDDQKATGTTTTTSEGTKTTGGTNTTIVSDTAKRTTISVGPGGTTVSTKKGTEVSIDSKGVKVGSKDVKVDIKTGN